MAFLYILLMVVVLVVLFNWQPMLKPPAHVSAKENQLVQKNFNWLRTSSFITIPSCVFLAIFFEITGSYRYQAHYRVAAAVLPLIWHFGVFARLRIKNLYVFRQTQQALVLLILRSASAAIALVTIDQGGLWWFIVVNGALWLFGGNWYYRQLKNNTCWLMTNNREEIILVDEVSAAKIICSSCGKPLVNTDVFCPHCGYAFAAPNSALAQTYLDEGLRLFIEENNKKAATKKLLLAFQSGAPDIRHRAVEALDKLGEVEKF